MHQFEEVSPTDESISWITLPILSVDDCGFCQGEVLCQFCGGTGMVKHPQGGSHACLVCSGSGGCFSCQGLDPS